ncbi:MAG TPA: DEAD/DEAH box helicase, partial [Xanthobacteraceae bacterium]|nr:DEAD/DEAH box helicase [Xanthobacteraceae bacterium]
LTSTFLHNPARIEVSKPASTVANVTQVLVPSASDPEKKREVLRRLIREAEGLKNGIIFCNRKTEVAKLHRSLVKHGFSAAALHGDMSQPARTKALDGFRANEMTLLVASDVAARGLDIPDVSHIFNFDVPHHAEDYVHRIGRTGRAGRGGAALMLASSADKKSIAAIEKLIGKEIPWAGEAPREEPTAAGREPHRESGPRRDGGRRRRGRGGRSGPRPAAHTEPHPASHPIQQAEPRQEESHREQPRQEQPRHEARVERHKDAPAGATADSAQLPAFLLRPVPQRAS